MIVLCYSSFENANYQKFLLTNILPFGIWNQMKLNTLLAVKGFGLLFCLMVLSDDILKNTCTFFARKYQLVVVLTNGVRNDQFMRTQF